MGEHFKKVINIDKFYKSGYIIAHPAWEEDVMDLINRSGIAKDFARKLRFNLRILEQFKKESVHHSSFEQLKHIDDDFAIYSMRFKNKLNIRILFTFMHINGKEKAVLLLAFSEKSKGKKGTSYQDVIPEAIKRLKDIECREME
ncbi:hypothetical protein SAMN02745221_02195 [Thermosyntropha lipolytica DSM 11003]|uniref:Phage derived protein Gp49-like n=1 Tax=Thermosyntropha lipolytica DSM 11003 TaxID=1123382 RepID=A0A1M5SBJ9_9FIRM|nr:hypothetical protein [Thermosyntropha lipolytica]SHH35658.1 hypothetical protein SAMN02745221_02195 [Thermosyntropha lipolytica DSM 11003]